MIEDVRFVVDPEQICACVDAEERVIRVLILDVRVEDLRVLRHVVRMDAEDTNPLAEKFA